MRTPLRVVLDTNVWLDWLVFDDPTIAPIKAAVATERAEVFIDAACEAELERALGYDLGKRTGIHAAMDRDYAILKELFERIIDRTWKSASSSDR